MSFRQLRLADVRWVLTAAPFTRREVREVVGAWPVEGGFAILKMQRGYYACWRDGRRELHEGLAELVDSLGVEATAVLPFSVEEAAAADGFEIAATLVAADELGEALAQADPDLRALVEAAGPTAPTGHGIRPVLRASDSPAGRAGRFAWVASLLRHGSVQEAIVTAAELLASLGQEGWSAQVAPPRARSVMDGFFSPGDPDDVRAAVYDSQRQDASPTDRSWGEVMSPETFNGRTRKPDRKGLESALIFGPCEPFACLCRKYVGRVHEGTVCEKCGVLVSSTAERDWRWGHLQLPVDVLHPALFNAAAAALDLSVAQLRGVLDKELSIDDDAVVAECEPYEESTGIVAIVAQLKRRSESALLVDRVPVLPPGDRPYVLDLEGPDGPEQYEPDLLMPYRALINRRNRTARLIELEAPDIIVRNEHRMLQEAVEHLVGAVRGDAPEASPGEDESGPADTIGIHHESGDREDPTWALLWLDAERLVVQRPTSIVVVDLDGQVLAEHPPDHRRIAFAHGDYLVGFGRYPSLQEWEGWQMSDCGVLQLGVGWLDQWPPEVPALLVEHDQPEDAWLVNGWSGARSVVGSWSDRPTAEAWSADGSVLFVSDCGYGGALVRTETGREFRNVSDIQGILEWFVDVDAPAVVAAADAQDSELEEAVHSAIGRTAGGEWLVAVGENVGFTDFPLFGVQGQVRAYAFHPDGERLAILTPQAVVLVDVGLEAAPQILVSLALDEWAKHGDQTTDP